MALINCSECGKPISDKAASCPNCGCPIDKIQLENNHFEKEREKKDYSKMAAQVEKKKVESRITTGNHTAGIIAIILGILSLLHGIFANGGLEVILGGLFFLFIGIITLNSIKKDKKRIQYLQNISDGKKEILLCPYCKGVNITFDVVQSEIHTSGQIAKVSDNVNPLSPFTHTNIETNGTRSSVSYKTLYLCNDCGKAFDNPNRVWS